VTPIVRFEDEAEAEYREAGRWYDVRRSQTRRLADEMLSER